MRNALALLLFLHVILSGESAFAVGKETLVDITGVAVVVDDVSSAAGADGLKEADVKALVEDRLARANIMVLEDRKWTSVFGGSYLLVKIIASKAVSGDRYAVYVDMELYQTVVLMGKKLGQNINTAAATWSAGMLLSCNAAVIKDCVEGTVGELTDLFIKDYIEVNTLRWKQEQERLQKEE
ncbi:MAG: hypothetical protein AB1598_14710 [Thermodesulfobacteriota bacterium]